MENTWYSGVRVIARRKNTTTLDPRGWFKVNHLSHVLRAILVESHQQSQTIRISSLYLSLSGHWLRSSMWNREAHMLTTDTDLRQLMLYFSTWIKAEFWGKSQFIIIVHLQICKLSSWGMVTPTQISINDKISWINLHLHNCSGKACY